MTFQHVHVIGAGLAGLSAAMDLVAAGVAVTVHEAGPAAGGRCCSYFDRELGCRLDNGNHLLLSGNRVGLRLPGPRRGARHHGRSGGAGVPVHGCVYRGSDGPCAPMPAGCPGGCSAAVAVCPAPACASSCPFSPCPAAAPTPPVAGTLRPGELYRRLLEPLAVAALNTPPETASAALLGAVMNESLALGGAACIPAFPREGLSESFIDPAVAWLRDHGAEVLLSQRVARMDQAGGRVTSVNDRPVAGGEAVVLAAPAPVAAGLLPGLQVPDQFEAILNVHYRCDADPGEAGFTGPGRRHCRVGVRQARRRQRHHQRRQPPGGPATCGFGDTGVGRCARRPGLAATASAMARGKGEAGNLRRHTGAGSPPSPCQDWIGQPGAGRRLDPHRVARNDRRCDQVWLHRSIPPIGWPACGLNEYDLIPCRAKPLTRPLVDYDAPDGAARSIPGDIPDRLLEDAISRASAALTDRQRDDGHWVFELEADATIPAEYVLLEHYLDRIEPDLQARIGIYLRRIQGAHGGWPLFHGGAFNLSASVKAYYALKAIGDDPDAPHMARARAAILAAGGAERTNVFTRIQLALFGQVPWRAVPAMPVEIMHLPRWFPFHLSKVSYWSRTVMVPLLVLMALHPRARNPRGIEIQELFCTPPERVRDWIRGPYRSGWGAVFKAIDGVVRVAEPAFPATVRARAIDGAVAFVTERLNGEDGLGAIYPAMANTVMMFDALGFAADHPPCRHRLGRGAEAAGGDGGRSLLPALPVAHLGHQPGRPCGCGGGGRGNAGPGCRLRLAGGAPGDGPARRLGRCPGRMPRQAAGRSSMRTRTTRTWTTPPWSGCCCTATATRPMPTASPAPRLGCWGCRAPTAAGAPSMPTTPMTT